MSGWNRMAFLAGAAMALAFAPGLSSQDAAAQSGPCANAVTQRDMTECAGEELGIADDDLNAAYQQAVAAMRETDGYLSADLAGAEKSLREAQRAWIPFRDRACETYGFLARGGSMEPMLVVNCLTDLTRERTDRLRALANGLGN